MTTRILALELLRALPSAATLCHMRQVFRSLSSRARKRRAALLTRYIRPTSDWRILDLGGGTGDHIHRVFPDHRGVTVCDYSAADLAVARDRYGYRTVLADGSDELPFDRGEFDLVFCSSVIEHVTGPKNEVLCLTDGAKFRAGALQHQRHFAAEIQRVGKRYYVQTPHKYFVVESHTWLPFPIVLMPRPAQMAVIRHFNRFWPKTTQPDWNLLTPSQVQAMFPDSRVVIERFAGLPKSIMAIGPAGEAALTGIV